MGLLATNQAAREIADDLGIDIRIATSIANNLNQQIFLPFQVDIDKIYNPISEKAAPKILEEIRPAIKMPASAPAPLPHVPPSASPTSATIPATSKQESTKSATVPSPTPVPKPVFFQTESTSQPIPNAPNFRIPTIAEDIMAGKKDFKPLPTASAVVEFDGALIPKKDTPTTQSSTAPKITIVRYGSEKSAPPMPEPSRTITEITPETLKTVTPAPKAVVQPPFAPLSQIPIPSPMAPKPPVSTMPVPPKSPTTVNPSILPTPKIPEPAGQPEKIVQKDYSETEK